MPVVINEFEAVAAPAADTAAPAASAAPEPAQKLDPHALARAMRRAARRHARVKAH